MVEYLLQHKADVTSTNMSGSTALFLAAESIHKEMCQVKTLLFIIHFGYIPRMVLFSYYWSGKLISNTKISKVKLFLIL